MTNEQLVIKKTIQDQNYNKPITKKEREFVIDLLKSKKPEFVKKINNKIKEIKIEEEKMKSVSSSE